jgi:hypothetical protein
MSHTSDRKGLAKPAKGSGAGGDGQPQPEQPPSNQHDDSHRELRKMLASSDNAERKRAANLIHLEGMAGGILARQHHAFGSLAGESAALFVGNLLESMRPRDFLEQMLCLQAAWTHARLAHLSGMANQQTETKNVRVVHDACDRAANTFRRQMLALVEYRRPPRTDAFVAIKQANVANQQVVQNAEIRKTESANGSNEQGSAPPKALPPHADGVEFIATGRAEQPAVAVEHRAEDGGGKGPLKDERDETR